MDSKSHKYDSWRVPLETIGDRLKEAALRSKGWRNLVVVKTGLVSALPFKSLGETVLSSPSFHCLKEIMGIQLAHGDDISIMNNARGLEEGC